MRRRARRLLAALPLLVAAIPATAGAGAPARSSGEGWRLVRADLDVHIDPGGQRIRVEADLILELTGVERSDGPTIWVNTRDSLMEFVEVSSLGARDVELNVRPGGSPPIRGTHIRFDRPLQKGSQIRVRAVLDSSGDAPQFLVAPQIAYASWVHGWYPLPWTLGRGFQSVAKVQGTTRFHLPPGWRSVSNGGLIERVETERGAVETWVAVTPLARGFVAGPYRVATHRTANGDMRLFRLDADPTGDRELADALVRAVRVMEDVFGPHPYPVHSLAEVPEWVTGFFADAEQGFIMAKSSAFELPRGGVALFGHEAAHAWWPSLVGSRDPGAWFLSESLAQFSAVYALERLHGPEAARAFLRFGEGGFSQNHDARAYFQLLRQGRDVPLARLDGRDRFNRYLANSKGAWVYDMLQRRVGEDVFASVFRELVRTYRGREISLDELRAAFLHAAPEAGLETFFDQWLLRTGAPILEARWEPGRDDRVVVAITQEQAGEPYHLMLDLEIEDRDGTRTRHRVELRERRSEVTLPAPGGLRAVHLDPDHRLLVWTPEYGPRPRALAAAAESPRPGMEAAP